MTVTDIDMPPPARRNVAGRGPTYDEAAAVMQAAGLEPLCLYPGGNIPWPNRCTECRSVVTPRYAHVKNGSSRGCKECGERLHPKHRPRIDPAAAADVMRSAGVEPLVDFPGPNTPWECVCLSCEEEVAPRYDHVKGGRSSGCRFCAKTAVTERQAVAVMELANLEPLEPYPGNNKAPWQVKCRECDWIGPATYSQARVLGNGCRRCGGRTFDPAEMAQMMRDNGFEPLIPYPGVDVSWPCICTECGRETIKLAQNVRAGSGCMRCAGKILAADDASERMMAAGYQPLEPYPGKNHLRWRCLCRECGMHLWTSYKAVMRGRGAGCCGGRFDLRRPDSSMGVYLIVHEEMNAAKIGVGVVRRGTMVRLRQHERRGWVPVAMWAGLPDVWMAFDVERRVLRSWRSAGLPQFLSKSQMPDWGYTETVQLDLIDLANVERDVDEHLVELGIVASCAG